MQRKVLHHLPEYLVPILIDAAHQIVMTHEIHVEFIREINVVSAARQLYDQTTAVSERKEKRE